MLALSWAAPCAGGPTSNKTTAPETGTASRDDLDSRAVPKRKGDVESRRVGGRSDDDKSDGWGRMLGALAVVAVLIFAARWFLRRWDAAGPTALAGPMEVLARAPVAPRQQLLLVRLGKRLVLIGAGGGAMSTLAEVTDPAEVNELIQAVKSPTVGALAGLLRRCAGGGRSAKDAPGGPGAAEEK